MKELDFDARKISPKEQEELRKKIVRKMDKHIDDDPSIYKVYEIVADICECSLSHVKNTWLRYKKNGTSGIKAVKMGRPEGRIKLSKEQANWIKKAIVENDPNQLKMKSFVWDRQAVSELIKREFDIEMPLSTMGDYLRSWGFTAQRPTLKNAKQNSEAVNKWLKEEYPKI